KKNPAAAEATTGRRGESSKGWAQDDFCAFDPPLLLRAYTRIKRRVMGSGKKVGENYRLIITTRAFNNCCAPGNGMVLGSYHVRPQGSGTHCELHDGQLGQSA